MKLKTLIIAATLIGSTSSVLAGPLGLRASIETEPVVKVTPQYGVTKLKGDYVDYNSTISPGVAVDYMLSRYFSIGVIFNYSLFELYDDEYVYSDSEIDLHQYNIGIQTKFFFLPYGIVRPFISTGVTYGYNELKFSDDNDYDNSLYSYSNNETLSYGSVAGTVILGSEVRFSRNVGLVIDGRYTQNFATGLNRTVESDDYYDNYGSVELENMEYKLEDTFSASLNVGLVIAF